MKTLLTFLIVLISFSSFAQKDKHERIKALKTAFLTEALELSSKEAQAFWPIYNEHSDQLHDLYERERREVKDKLKSAENMSESTYETLLETHLTIDESKMSLRRTLVENLEGVISKKKVLKLFKAEDDFRKKLIKEYRDRKKNSPSPLPIP